MRRVVFQLLRANPRSSRQASTPDALKYFHKTNLYLNNGDIETTIDEKDEASRRLYFLVSVDLHKEKLRDGEGNAKDTPITYKDEDLSNIVEGALKQTDKNNDGYIDYLEYRVVTGAASPDL
ncbi:unnamed protein product [Pieris macdunnoughi]|uniref:EF-hand domain-containing protein n=1 Tax=Pieris macdunnoughi TaxID=345717 RepID=A0A821XH19_9NEOP|nr:unnamed protein product [Pieris macdunnoughi]